MRFEHLQNGTINIQIVGVSPGRGLPRLLSLTSATLVCTAVDHRRRGFNGPFSALVALLFMQEQDTKGISMSDISNIPDQPMGVNPDTDQQAQQDQVQPTQPTTAQSQGQQTQQTPQVQTPRRPRMPRAGFKLRSRMLRLACKISKTHKRRNHRLRTLLCSQRFWKRCPGSDSIHAR